MGVQAPFNSIGADPQGTATALNITAAQVVKASPGRLMQIVVTAVGTTSGGLTINDCTTVAAAAASNVMFSVLLADMTVGQIITLDVPALNGIVVSAVPGGGSPIYAISYI